MSETLLHQPNQKTAKELFTIDENSSYSGDLVLPEGVELSEGSVYEEVSELDVPEATHSAMDIENLIDLKQQIADALRKADTEIYGSSLSAEQQAAIKKSFIESYLEVGFDDVTEVDEEIIDGISDFIEQPMSKIEADLESWLSEQKAERQAAANKEKTDALIKSLPEISENLTSMSELIKIQDERFESEREYGRKMFKDGVPKEVRMQYIEACRQMRLAEIKRGRAYPSLEGFQKFQELANPDQELSNGEDFGLEQAQFVKVERNSKVIEDDWVFMGIDAKSGLAEVAKVEEETGDKLFKSVDPSELQVLNELQEVDGSSRGGANTEVELKVPKSAAVEKIPQLEVEKTKKMQFAEDMITLQEDIIQKITRHQGEANYDVDSRLDKDPEARKLKAEAEAELAFELVSKYASDRSKFKSSGRATRKSIKQVSRDRLELEADYAKLEKKARTKAETKVAKKRAQEEHKRQRKAQRAKSKIRTKTAKRPLKRADAVIGLDEKRNEKKNVPNIKVDFPENFTPFRPSSGRKGGGNRAA